MKKILYFIFAACALLYSCAKEALEDHIVEKNANAIEDITIQLSQGDESNSYILNIYQDLKNEFYVRCLHSWKITNIPSWLHVTPNEGVPSLDGITLTCIAEPNYTDKPRFGTMYLEVEGKRLSINIVQDSPTFNAEEPFDGVNIRLLKHAYGYTYGINTFEKEGGVYFFQLLSAYDWEFTYVPYWVTVEPMSGNGSIRYERKIIITASKNNGTYRSGKVKLKVGDNIMEIGFSQY